MAEKESKYVLETPQLTHPSESSFKRYMLLWNPIYSSSTETEASFCCDWHYTLVSNKSSRLTMNTWVTEVLELLLENLVHLYVNTPLIKKKSSVHEARWIQSLCFCYCHSVITTYPFCAWHASLVTIYLSTLKAKMSFPIRTYSM